MKLPVASQCFEYFLIFILALKQPVHYFKSIYFYNCHHESAATCALLLSCITCALRGAHRPSRPDLSCMSAHETCFWSSHV